MHKCVQCGDIEEAYDSRRNYTEHTEGESTPSTPYILVVSENVKKKIYFQV